MNSRIQVTLVANAGLLLRDRNMTILVDALFRDEECSFCMPSESTYEKLLRGAPPFENIDYVLFTHLHADHFSEALTREFLCRHGVKGLILPASDSLERQGFFDWVMERGIPCAVLTEHTGKAVFRLSPEIQLTAVRTLHLDRKYHGVPHFCYLIAFGDRKLLLTADADYTEDSFAFLGEETIRAAFVNPLFFSDLHRRRFFHGSLPAETVVVYHLPFPEEERQLQQMFLQSLRDWPKEGPPVVVLDRELQSAEL